MRRYTPASYKMQPTVKAVGASETNTVVSRVFPITVDGSQHLRIKVTAASTTVATAITVQLQHGINDGGTFVTQSKAATSITGNGDFYIRFNAEVAGDQADLPLMCLGRVAVTTGAGDAVTISEVMVLQGN